MSQATSFPGADRILFKNDQSTTVHQKFRGIWCYKIQFGVIFGLFFSIVVVPSNVFSVCLLCEYLCMCSHMCKRTLRMWRRLLWHLEPSSPTFFFFTAMASLSVHNTLPWISQHFNLIQQGNILHSKSSLLAIFFPEKNLVENTDIYFNVEVYPWWNGIFDLFCKITSRKLDH